MANGNFGGGDGTAGSPFLVEDAMDFSAIRGYKNGVHFSQSQNIDMSTLPLLPLDIGATGVHTTTFFTGSYNGNGFFVSNLVMRTDHTSPVSSFFGSWRSFLNTNFENLTIEFTNTSPAQKGGLFDDAVTTNVHLLGPNNLITFPDAAQCGGFSSKGAHKNSSIKATIRGTGKGGTYSGTGPKGVAGFVGNGSAEDCFADVDISTSYGASGFVYIPVTITRCYSKGRVEGASVASGFAHITYYGDISDCYSLADVITTGAAPASGFVSYTGLVGSSGTAVGRITNCYHSGRVYSPTMPYGFTEGNTGSNSYTILKNCFALAKTLYTQNINLYAVSFIQSEYPASRLLNCHYLSTMEVQAY